MSSIIRQKDMLTQTEEFIKEHFEHEGSGHDWWHIYRVRNLSKKIANQEGGNLFIIEMAALLHDLDDWKLSDEKNSSQTIDWLKQMNLSRTESSFILEIIDQVSFKGAHVNNIAVSIEAQIVQDADRLDAMGAIGIARTFSYGGHKGRLLHHPDIKPQMHSSFEDYKKTTAPTINHFYEKLLLLKDKLNTPSAKRMAAARHRFMENYLEQFFSEWESEI